MQLFLFKQVNSLALRLLPWLLLTFGLCVAQSVHAATTYRYGGADVKFCKLKDKTYTCNKLPFTEWNDGMAIDSGYTVDFTADVAFGWGNGLAMSGSARLTSSGNLNVGDIAPNNIAISGGSLHAGGKFTIGNVDQKITANVTAGSMQLGSGSKLEITGSVAATGVVNIAANAIVNGSVTGGDVITGTSVRINGNVDAKGGRVVLNHDTQVKGAVNARVVELLATQVVVTGSVKATESLNMASGVTVDGNVDTGLLTLESSGAIVKGSALVTRANLYDRGRVTGLIQCRAGATVNDCSCVNNQSGYPFNSELGPKCGAANPPPANALHHFLLEHDNSAGTCTAAKVKVTACADASCFSRYTGGATVTLQPGGASATLDSSGVTNAAQVASIADGTIRLSLGATSPAPSSGLVCRNNATDASSCDMTFTGGVNFNMTVPDHKAGNSAIALITAVKANDNKTECVPAAEGEKSVDFSCSYTLPGSGTLALSLDPTPGGTPSDTTSLMCGGAKKALGAVFDSRGTAKVELSYPDVGRVTVEAAAGATRGKTSFVVAPDGFKLGAPSPLRAGLDFDLTLQAVNKLGDVTPNFDATLLGVDAPDVKVAHECIKGNNLVGSLTLPAPVFKAGSARPAARFSDVGSIDVKATLESFLGVKQIATGSTNNAANGCAGNVGPFVPMYYQVELGETARLQTRKDKTFSYYYSDEPIRLKVSAMNAQGGVSANYPIGYGAQDKFEFLAMNENGVALAANLGQLAGSLDVADFSSGVATWNATRKSPYARYRFTAAQTAPTQLRLRVQTQNKAAGYFVTSADADTYKDKEPEKVRPVIRTGRLRIGSRFGPARTNLDLLLTAEYWSGNSWVRNDDDDFTLIPASAFGLGVSSGEKPAVTPAQLTKGAGTLRLRRDSVGWIDVAINLGLTASDSSCLVNKATSTGAAMPWLQSRSGCTDPSGRATFGVQSTENRRIIHVRETYR